MKEEELSTLGSREGAEQAGRPLRSFWDPCCGRLGDESALRARVGSWAVSSAAGEIGR